MPKVSKKDARTPLQEVAPVPMDVNAEVQEPASTSKPQFAPLSAYEQNGKKVEFRRVGTKHVSLCRIVSLLQLARSSSALTQIVCSGDGASA